MRILPADIAGLATGLLIGAVLAGAVLISRGMWRPEFIVGPSAATIAKYATRDARAPYAHITCVRHDPGASCAARTPGLQLARVTFDGKWRIVWDTDPAMRLEA